MKFLANMFRQKQREYYPTENMRRYIELVGAINNLSSNVKSNINNQKDLIEMCLLHGRLAAFEFNVSIDAKVDERYPQEKPTGKQYLPLIKILKEHLGNIENILVNRYGGVAA